MLSFSKLMDSSPRHSHERIWTLLFEDDKPLRTVKYIRDMEDVPGVVLLDSTNQEIDCDNLTIPYYWSDMQNSVDLAQGEYNIGILWTTESFEFREKIYKQLITIAALANNDGINIINLYTDHQDIISGKLLSNIYVPDDESDKDLNKLNAIFSFSESSDKYLANVNHDNKISYSFEDFNKLSERFNLDIELHDSIKYSFTCEYNRNVFTKEYGDIDFNEASYYFPTQINDNNEILILTNDVEHLKNIVMCVAPSGYHVNIISLIDKDMIDKICEEESLINYTIRGIYHYSRAYCEAHKLVIYDDKTMEPYNGNVMFYDDSDFTDMLTILEEVIISVSSYEGSSALTEDPNLTQWRDLLV